jgi:hypothetical protein
MEVTLDITPELASRLLEAAAKEGLDANGYILHMLEEHVRHIQRRSIPCLREDEAHLLQQINQGLPQETWQRYHELIDKRRAESLTPDEHATLIALSDQIEELNARRVGYLVELARLRQTPLEALMQQLGIQTLPYV